MSKFAVVIALIALSAYGVCGQDEPQGAPEPYSYGYQTDTHGAAEQRDPSGKVTGYYMLADADGRQRRVDYEADAAGFRAKVQTNELGTKSENSADVEVQAAPPTEAQLAPVPVRQQQQYVQVQQAPQVQRVQYVQQPARAQVNYVQQPAGYGYGYYPGYGYGQSTYSQGYYNPGYGYYGNGYGYGSGYRSGYRSGYGGYGVANGLYGAQYSSYNNHLPSQYYQSIGQPGVYSTGNGVVGRYSVSSVQPASGVVSGSYRTSTGYQTVGVPAGSVSYSSVPATVGSTSNLAGSSNYIVLKKRDSQEATAAAASDKKNE